MKFILLVLIITVPGSALYADTSADTSNYVRAQKYSALAWNYGSQDPDSSIFYARVALAMSRRFHYPLIESRSLSNIAYAKSKLEEYDSARIYFGQSLKKRLLLKDTIEISSGYNNLGLFFHRIDLYDSAIFYFQKGILLATDAKYEKYKSKLLNGLSMSLLRKGNIVDAEQKLFEAIELDKRNNDQMGLANKYLNLGNIYEKIGSYQQAMKYYELAESSFDKNDINALVNVYFNQAVVYQQLGDDSLTIVNYEEALALTRDVNFLDKRASIFNNMGMLYAYSGQFAEAKKSYLECLRLAQEGGKSLMALEVQLNLIDLKVAMNDFIEANQQIREIEKGVKSQEHSPTLQRFYFLKAHVKTLMGQFKEANEAHLLYIGLSDSLNQLVNHAQINLAQMEQDKRDKIILEQENALQATELEKEKAQSRLQWLGIAILLLFLIAVVIVASLRLRNAQVKNVALAEKKKSEEKLQDLLRQVDVQLLETQLEANRSASHRIGQDLHDNLGSKLAVVQMSIGGIRTKMGGISEEITGRFDEVERFLEESCRDLRDIAHNLQDRELKYRGLVKELNQYLQLIRDAQGIEVRLVPDGFPEKINESAQKDILAIVRLLVENVLRHAEASKMDITMKMNEEHFWIEVRDNGKGFITESNHEGKGLANAKSRAERLDGTFSVTSQPQKGTTAVLTIPLNNL